jgi:hypothetical protein
MAIYENWVHEFSKNPGYKNPENHVVITIGIYIPKSSKSHPSIHPIQKIIEPICGDGHEGVQQHSGVPSSS